MARRKQPAKTPPAASATPQPPREPSSTGDPPPASRGPGSTGEPPPASSSCPICGTALYGVHCKLNCPNCGYREDCSDLFRTS
jgi:hypothetical protein